MKALRRSGMAGPLGILAALVLALAGAAVNRWFALELAFGVSILVGSPLGVLAGILAPWPFGIFGPFIALLPTLALWAHPWALASVLLEGLMIALLIRKGRLDRVILYEAFYWPLIGAPLVFAQYSAFLGMGVSRALAAATKQGVNAFFAAVFGILLYYVLRALLKGRFASVKLPDAREYLTLFLEMGLFFPVMVGVLLYTEDRKHEVLVHAERETSIILSILVSQDPDTITRSLSGVLGVSGHQASMLDSNGVLIWSTAVNPRLLYADGLALHSYENALVVGALAESNPMKRWSGSIVRAEYEYADGSRLVVTQPLTLQVLSLDSRLTSIFGFLLLWLAAAAGMAFIAATLLVRPLERLRRVAKELQKGEAEVSWPSFGILEIQDLRDSLVAMTGAMEQRGMDLAEAMKAAQDLMRRGESYLAFMSHELKAPLAALSAAFSAEEEGADRVDPATIRESLSRLLELIDDILDQARSSAGKLPLRAELFNPAREASALLEPFAIQARRKGLGFIVHIGGALSVNVRGDPLRYRQVIANLVSNALKYTKDGGIKVSLDGQQSMGQLILTATIEDTGMGIAVDRLDAVWKPFSANVSQASEGLSSHGLGLSIVRSIVEAMSGSIELASEEGKGSIFTFKLRFPLEESAPAGNPALAALHAGGKAGGQVRVPEKPDLKGLRVLVADDERISRMAVSHFLRSWGATVDEYGSGSEALEAHSSTMYDLVVLDEHMPGLGGRDVIKQIRARERFSGRRRSFLVISSAEAGHGALLEPQAQDAQDAQDDPDALLPKPVQKSALAALLQRIGS